MRIRSDRRHSFAISPDELWDAMGRLDAYRAWWPWLRRFDAATLAPGTTWSAVVQPPLPYRLRFDLHLGEVEPPRVVTADVTGDIAGSARLEISPVGDGCELHLLSELRPTNPLLRAVARMAAPVARFGHDWVLDTGLRQFQDRALR